MADGGKAPRLSRRAIPKTKKYCHCMLLLRITQEEFTLVEIATMYGLTAQGITHIERRGMKKLLQQHRDLLTELATYFPERR